MAVYCEPQKLIYCLAPRTASTATADLLIKKYEGVWIPTKDITDPTTGNYIVQKKHTTFKQITENHLISNEDFKKCKRLVTVRNPFDSLYSLWYKKKVSYTPLLEDKTSFIYKIPGFVQDMEFISENNFDSWFIKTYNGAYEAGNTISINMKFVHGSTHILYFENLQDSFDKFCNASELQTNKIELINITQGRNSSYREFYSKRSINIGNKVFQKELLKFNYSF